MSEGKPAELSCSCSRLGWWASVCEKSARERARGFCVLVSETLAFVKVLDQKTMVCLRSDKMIFSIWLVTKYVQ